MASDTKVVGTQQLGPLVRVVAACVGAPSLFFGLYLLWGSVVDLTNTPIWFWFFPISSVGFGAFMLYAAITGKSRGWNG